VAARACCAGARLETTHQGYVRRRFAGACDEVEAYAFSRTPADWVDAFGHGQACQVFKR
jgi:hypothetical protein